MIVNRNFFENAQGVIYPQSAVVCDLFPNTSSTFIGGFQNLNTSENFVSFTWRSYQAEVCLEVLCSKFNFLLVESSVLKVSGQQTLRFGLMFRWDFIWENLVPGFISDTHKPGRSEISGTYLFSHMFDDRNSTDMSKKLNVSCPASSNKCFVFDSAENFKRQIFFKKVRFPGSCSEPKRESWSVFYIELHTTTKVKTQKGTQILQKKKEYDVFFNKSA